MSGHTPGEWAAECGDGVWRVRVKDGDYAGQLIADFMESSEIYSASRYALRDDEPEDHGEANARLFVAAPDLLAALKEMTPTLPPADAPCHVGIVSQENCGHCGQIFRALAAIAKAEGRP